MHKFFTSPSTSNPDKANITYVKNAYREMLGKNDASGNFILSNSGEEIFDVIWNNSNLKNNIWNPMEFPNGLLKNQAKLQFQVNVNNSSFFSFIE